MPELKPCPFCVTDAYTTIDILNDRTLMLSIKCKKCGIRKIHKLSTFGADFNSVIDVINILKAEWNERIDNAINRCR